MCAVLSHIVCGVFFYIKKYFSRIYPKIEITSCKIRAVLTVLRYTAKLLSWKILQNYSSDNKK